MARKARQEQTDDVENLSEEQGESQDFDSDSEDAAVPAPAKAAAKAAAEADDDAADRERVRAQLEDDVAAFLAKGGTIEAVPADYRADPPKKPQSNYGSRSI